MAENIQGGWGKCPLYPSDKNHDYVNNTLLSITCMITDYLITLGKEELQSKLEKKDEIVKELESIQERKSYVTLQLN